MMNPLKQFACRIMGHPNEKEKNLHLRVVEFKKEKVCAYLIDATTCGCGVQKIKHSDMPIYQGTWTGFLEWKRSKWTMTKRNKVDPFEGQPVLPMGENGN